MGAKRIFPQAAISLAGNDLPRSVRMSEAFTGTSMERKSLVPHKQSSVPDIHRIKGNQTGVNGFFRPLASQGSAPANILMGA